MSAFTTTLSCNYLPHYMGSDIIASGLGALAMVSGLGSRPCEDFEEISGGYEASPLAEKYRPSNARMIRFNPGVRLFQPSQAPIEIPRKDLPEWGNTKTRLTKTFKYIVEEYFDGDVRKVSTGRNFLNAKYKLPSGQLISGHQIVGVTARIERHNMAAVHAIKAIGMKNIVKLIREKYLAELFAKQDWGSTADKMKDTLSFIVDNYYDGIVNNLRAAPIFFERTFTLPSDQKVSGSNLLTALAKLEHPEISPSNTLSDMGAGEVLRIAREKYLSELYDAQNWDGTYDKLRDTLLYIVEHYLDGYVQRISASSNFRRDIFILPSGLEVSGQRLLYAVARLEKPGYGTQQAYRAIGGSEVVQIVRKKYLYEYHDKREWGHNFERLRDTLTYVVENYLDGDVSKVKAGPSFLRGKFVLPSGQEVRGENLLRAIAKLERPETASCKAYKLIGGSEVARIAREVYLSEFDGEHDWGSTYESMRITLMYVVDTYLDGDVNRLSSGYKFLQQDFTLSSGDVVSGSRLLRAVAKLEQPDIHASKAFKTIGSGDTARIAREKYLSDHYDKNNWGGTVERLRNTLLYVIEKHLGGDAFKINTSYDFMLNSFTLPTGHEVRGEKLLRAVAGLEWPNVSPSVSIKSMGASKVARIAREKYLFSLDDTPESFVHAMKLMMGDDGDEDGGDA